MAKMKLPMRLLQKKNSKKGKKRKVKETKEKKIKQKKIKQKNRFSSFETVDTYSS